MSSTSSSSRNNEPGAFDSDDEWELVNDSPLSSPLPGGSPVKVAFSPIRLGPASVPPVSPALTIPDDPNSTGSNDSFVNVSDNDSWGKFKSQQFSHQNHLARIFISNSLRRETMGNKLYLPSTQQQQQPLLKKPLLTKHRERNNLSRQKSG